MKYGILLLQDSVYSYPKDQIRLEDRVLDNYDDMRSVRINSITGKDTNSLLSKVRNKHEELYYWNKSLDGLPKYAYIMVGLDELKGGASHKWNNRHLEALIIELSVYDFEIVLFTTSINKNLKENQLSWSREYRTRVKKLSSKYNLDILVHRQKILGMNREEITKIAKKISSHTKKVYAEKVIGEVPKQKPSTSSSIDGVEVYVLKPKKKKSKPITGITRPRRKPRVKEVKVVCEVPKEEIKVTSPKKPKKKGRKVKNVEMTIDPNSVELNLASY